MERLTYGISEDNRRRLEILKAFSILNRGSPTIQDIVNQSIQAYFVSAYEKYCEQCSTNDFLKAAMEEMLPAHGQDGHGAQIIRCTTDIDNRWETLSKIQ